ncbi:MAG: RdgB/HAM1 family non-canonical purine NTP pyrophosphatase [Clostridiales bacterium]|nr:RdgB/HAM1 family non-canonical purine NTP pyrophosphatase [Clostridiales bacterium]
MKFVLASHNENKLRELREILGALGVEIVLQSDLGLDLEPEETGETFEENSLIKAKAVMEVSGLPAIADDSGLCVDKLGGGPGVYSARYGGPGLTDAQKCQLILQAMQGQFPRTCKFVCVITCCFPDGKVLTARGECPGTVAFTPMGSDGFGYDPIFFVPKLKKTFAQLSAEEKNAISHRGNALRAFAGELEAYLKENV